MLVGGSLFNFNKSIPPDNGQPVNIQDTQPGTARKTLQIQGLQTATPAPTAPPPAPSPAPLTACSHDNGQIVANTGIPVTDITCKCPANLVTCQNKQCVSSYNQTSGIEFHCNPTWIYNLWCSTPVVAGSGTGVYCIGKPVIYLYPEKDTFVNVTLSTPGKIVESIPFYNNGWKNILAHPNGNLEYNGKSYKELYYESSVNNVASPKNGIVVKKEQIEPELKIITGKLGLVKSEQKEFLTYWMPRLKDLNSKYLFISVIDTKEKERIDKVLINPEPATRIEFLMYFKATDKFSIPPALTLPDNPPQRIGFTEVEWGGTIDGN